MSTSALAEVTPKFDAAKVSGPALKTFFCIVELWNLGNKEQMTLLGNPARATFFRWKRGDFAALPKDTLERISYILGIYSALQVLLSKTAAADAWIKKPNIAPIFGGRSALDRMLSGNVADLYFVRQYLDAQRGG